jgi:hypothetical protein
MKYFELRNFRFYELGQELQDTRKREENLIEKIDVFKNIVKQKELENIMLVMGEEQVGHQVRFYKDP